MSIVSGTLGAVMSSDSAGDATKANTANSANTLASQEKLYNADIARNQPFYDTGVQANARLNGMVTGQPQSYADPQYKAQTNQESAGNLWQRIQADHSLAGADFWKDIGNGEQPINRILRDSSLSSQLQQSTKYVGPNGEIVDKAPQISVPGGYDMKQSPAAQYELTQGTRSLNRQLAARGLLGSGNASQRLAELSSGVAANDYNQQYSRLLDQVKIGTGASASAGAASNVLGNQIGQNSAAIQQSNTQAGQARASLYGGMGGASASTVGAGINAYRSGLFGGSSGGVGLESSLASAPTAADAAGSLSQYESVAL